MIWISIFSSLIAVVAIIVSIVSFRKSHKVERRQLQIEEAREHDRLHEKYLAKLTAQIVEERYVDQAQYKKKTLLRIRNSGYAEARNIEVVLDDRPVFEHPTIRGQEAITQIGPQSHFDYLISWSMNSPKPKNISIRWEDDSEEEGEYSSTLS